MIFSAALLCLPACGGGRPAPVDDGYGYCPQETRVGGFVVEPGPEYTSVHGVVADAVTPASVMEVQQTAGDCTLLHPRTFFCDPSCAGGLTCDATGTCIDAPRNADVGTVEVVGLAAPVVMEAIAPILVYSFTGDLPHPAYKVSDTIALYVGDEGPDLVAYGVEDLVVDGTSMPLDSGAASTLTWTPTTSDVDARVRVSVDIANHGGVPAKIVCETADDGALDIDAALVDGLLEVGWSGFPTVTLVRQSADVGDLEGLCFDFVVRSTVTLNVDIEGLQSCSDDDDCPEGETCLPDLTCG